MKYKRHQRLDSQLRIAILVFPFAAPNLFSFSHKLATVVSAISRQVYFISGGIPGNLQWNGNIQVQDIGVRLHYVNDRKPVLFSAILWIWNALLAQWLLAWHIYKKRNEIDTIICFMGVYYQLPILVAKLTGKKVISASWGIYSQKAKMNYGTITVILTHLLSQISFSLSDGILVDSLQFASHQYLKPYETKIFNGALYLEKMEEKFQIRTPIENRAPLVGFVGRLVAEKGIMEFVEALPEIIKKRPGMDFLIIGSGRLDSKLKTILENSTWKTKVKWYRWIDHEKVPTYLNRLQLLVVPSYEEGLPNLIIEAMGCGTPVLATAVGGIPDLIKHRETGFILQENNPETIANAVIEAVDVPEIKNITHQARKLIEQNYSFKAAVNRYEHVFITLSENL